MIPVNEPLLPGNELKYVADCISTGWISSAGKYIDNFEKAWSAYCDRKYGVAVSNGTVALELAISALELPKDSEVILPSFTIASCLEAVLRNGLKPVLVDCDPRTYCMSVPAVESAITPNTSAAMPVHIYGHPVNMNALLKITKQYNLKVVEDAAEVHGATCRVNGDWRKCGSFGEVSCFSFFANKNITCGEGGIILTDNEALYRKMVDRRTLCFGHKERFCHEDRGWNFRMTNLQAALGCAQLENIDRFIKRKRSMAEAYNSGFNGLPLQLPFVENWANSSVWMYAILLKDEVPYGAVEFAKQLMDRGVQTRPFFRGMHDQPVYLERGLIDRFDCPVTDKIYQRGLYLPSGQAITDEQIDKVIQIVREVLV